MWEYRDEWESLDRYKLVDRLESRGMCESYIFTCTIGIEKTAEI